MPVNALLTSLGTYIFLYDVILHNALSPGYRHYHISAHACVLKVTYTADFIAAQWKHCQDAFVIKFGSRFFFVSFLTGAT